MSNDNNTMVDSIIELYYAFFPTVERVPVSVIITDNLNRKHCELRPEYKNKFKAVDEEFENDFNGRTVVPHSIDDTISILLNLNKIKEYNKDGSFTWIGTIAHELTHAVDYYQMARREKLSFYDPLEDIALYHMFQLWSEYHARKFGYRFLREFHQKLGNLDKEEDQIKYIVEKEWPFHKSKHYNDYHSGIDGNKQMYITMQLLGRYSVWCDLFPVVFNEEALSSDFYHTPWMGELFSFLRQHESLNEIYSDFEGLQCVLTKNWPFYN